MDRSRKKNVFVLRKFEVICSLKFGFFRENHSCNPLLVKKWKRYFIKTISCTAGSSVGQKIQFRSTCTSPHLTYLLLALLRIRPLEKGQATAAPGPPDWGLGEGPITLASKTPYITETADLPAQCKIRIIKDTANISMIH